MTRVIQMGKGLLRLGRFVLMKRTPHYKLVVSVTGADDNELSVSPLVINFTIHNYSYYHFSHLLVLDPCNYDVQFELHQTESMRCGEVDCKVHGHNRDELIKKFYSLNGHSFDLIGQR